MATIPTEKFEGPTNQPADIRAVATWMPVRKFAAGTGTLAKGTPVGVVTASDLYAEWDKDAVDGTEVIAGFLNIERAHTLDAGGETLAPVMLTGTIHIDDIPLPAGHALSDLKTALKTTARSKGLIIEGFPEAR